MFCRLINFPSSLSACFALPCCQSNVTQKDQIALSFSLLSLISIMPVPIVSDITGNGADFDPASIPSQDGKVFIVVRLLISSHSKSPVADC
jgi:hypothetical protein